MRDFSGVTNDDLADEITTLAGRLAAGEAEQLALIGEFERREAWAGPGLLSCAHWLTWRTGMSPNAARERVRVARALPELPLVSAAFGAGRLSWSQVRAITRVADADTEGDLVEMARHTTAAQLEKVVRGIRRVQQVGEEEADPGLTAYRMRTTTSYDADGNMVLRMVCSAQDGAVVKAALDQVKAELGQRRKAAEAQAEGVPAGTSAAPDELSEPQAPAGSGGVPAQTPDPVPVTLSEALLHLCRRSLEQETVERPAAARRRRASLLAQVDPLSGWGRLQDGELLPPSSLKAVLRTLPGRGGQPLLRTRTAADLSRTQRLPSLRLRELLGIIDGERCRFPGCTRHRTLHAHHIVRWSDGGATDFANLVLVCSRHHTLVHQHGFQLVLHPDRRLTVTTADGVRVLHHPALAWGDATALDPDGRIEAHTLPPDLVESRLDLGYVVTVMTQQAA